MLKTIALVLVLIGASGAPIAAQDRLPPIPPAKYTPEQKKVVEEFKALRNETGPGGGPYIILMRSPDAYMATAQLSAYLRFHSPIGPKLTEFVSFIAVYHAQSRYEYSPRYSGSLQQGVKKDVLDAIADGRRPAGMPEDEEIVYDFCTELHVNKYVSDATYDRALKKFGEQGVVDITAISGYYTYLGMLTNMARSPIRDPNNPPLPATFPRWSEKP